MSDLGAQIGIAVAGVGVVGAMLTWMQTSLRAEMRALHAKTEGRIDALDNKLSGRIDALDIKLTGGDALLAARIDGLDSKLSALDSSLSGRVDGLQEDFRRAFKLVPAGSDDPS